MDNLKEILVDMIMQLEDSTYLEIMYGFAKTALDNQESMQQKKDI